MTVFTCEEDFEAMMTAIYDAWASRLGHENIRLQTEPVFQAELFCTYVHVETDTEKAHKVMRSIQKKISSEAFRQVYLAAMSFEPDRLDAIYRFLLIGFACGHTATGQLAHPAVMRLFELSRKVSRESNYFYEFARFSCVAGQIYVAHIEPKCNVLALCARHFEDRMPSENWMMVDDNRRIAAVHPKDQPLYMTDLSPAVLELLCKTEATHDRYTDLWQEFFHATSIDARRNPACQRNLMPLWYRKHVTEFREVSGSAVME